MADIVRLQKLDKFYTVPAIAKHCIDTINELVPLEGFDLVIEPSAGNGSFFNLIDHCNKVGMDLSPEAENIIKCDFFDYSPSNPSQRILVIGNPPFGRVSSLAIRFFNHAARWADVVAFIIPKSFRKTSIQNRLCLEFHLIRDDDIPNKPCSFIPALGVKCCFQIWVRREKKRELITLPETHNDWEFVSGPNEADFALRRVGSKCGEIKTKLENLSKNWHWIKSNIPVKSLIERFEKLDYSDSENTARQNSIGKKELIQLYNSSYERL